MHRRNGRCQSGTGKLRSTSSLSSLKTGCLSDMSRPFTQNYLYPALILLILRPAFLKVLVTVVTSRPDTISSTGFIILRSVVPSINNYHAFLPIIRGHSALLLLFANYCAFQRSMASNATHDARGLPRHCPRICQVICAHPRYAFKSFRNWTRSPGMSSFRKPSMMRMSVSVMPHSD